MLTLAITIKTHTGIRLAEVGEAVGAIGGLALLVGGLTPFGRRAGEIVGGLAIAIGFARLVLATRWGPFPQYLQERAFQPEEPFLAVEAAAVAGEAAVCAHDAVAGE